MTKKMQFVKEVDSSYPYVPTHQYEFEYAKKYITGKKVLDLGCWNGAFENLLKNTKCKLVGVDPDPEALKVARKNFPKFKFVKADVLKKLPFRKEFDTVLMWMTIEHLPDERKSLTNLNRVMKKGGHIILSTPSNHPLSIFFDFPYFLFGHKHFNPKTLQQYLEETGFHIEESRVIGGFYVALRVSLLIFYKHFLRRPLANLPFIEKKQIEEYRSGKGFNEVFIKARKIKDI